MQLSNISVKITIKIHKNISAHAYQIFETINCGMALLSNEIPHYNESCIRNLLNYRRGLNQS